MEIWSQFLLLLLLLLPPSRQEELQRGRDCKGGWGGKALPVNRNPDPNHATSHSKHSTFYPRLGRGTGALRVIPSIVGNPKGRLAFWSVECTCPQADKPSIDGHGKTKHSFNTGGIHSAQLSSAQAPSTDGHGDYPYSDVLPGPCVCSADRRSVNRRTDFTFTHFTLPS